MANDFLAKYGIKEVADVWFYDIDSGAPVLYLDTLKVSTIEQTAEQTEAKGGKGNAPLIIWDYGKEINVTLEDALFSAKSMAVMFGDKEVGTSNKPIYNTTATASATGAAPTAVTVSVKKPNSTDTTNVSLINVQWYDSTGSAVSTLTSGVSYEIVGNLNVNSETIEISANSFPGTYKVVGDTYARKESNGEDEFFQFVIYKAKVQSENTITLEAEGDPSVFNLNLRVLRTSDGKMMELIKYDLTPAPVQTENVNQQNVAG